MSVRLSVRPSVCPVLFSKVKSTHTRRILCRVSGLVPLHFLLFLTVVFFHPFINFSKFFLRLVFSASFFQSLRCLSLPFMNCLPSSNLQTIFFPLFRLRRRPRVDDGFPARNNAVSVTSDLKSFDTQCMALYSSPTQLILIIQ